MIQGFIVKDIFFSITDKMPGKLKEGEGGMCWLTASEGSIDHTEKEQQGSSVHIMPGSREHDGMWPEIMYSQGPASSDSTSPARTHLQKLSVFPNTTTSRDQVFKT